MNPNWMLDRDWLENKQYTIQYICFCYRQLVKYRVQAQNMCVVIRPGLDLRTTNFYIISKPFLSLRFQCVILYENSFSGQKWDTILMEWDKNGNERRHKMDKNCLDKMRTGQITQDKSSKWTKLQADWTSA